MFDKNNVTTMAKREILFRGWNKKNKKWLYGYYCVNRGEHFIAPDEFVNPLASYEDNLPNLEWSEKDRYIEDFGEFEHIFCEESFSKTSFGDYSIRYFYYDKSYSLCFNDEKLSDNFKTIDEAKKEANDDYKNRIKMALKL